LPSNDNDSLEQQDLEHWEEVLSPAEMSALKWINSDPTRAYCSKDLMEQVGIKTKGTARNINWKLKKHGLIKPYCKSLFTFYKLKSTNNVKMKKPVTLYRMGVSGLRRIQPNFVSVLESLDMEEVCRVHDVHLTLVADGLYDALMHTGEFQPDRDSKDIFFGKFKWSEYRVVQVYLHRNDKVSLIADCGNCPIESSAQGFVSLAGFLGGIREKLLNRWRTADPKVSELSFPWAENWLVAMWHYGRDTAQEFSGEGFNVTFKMWCGELARIYVHEQDHFRKVRFEVTETPKKPLQEVISKKLDLCCGRCSQCSKQ